MSEPVRIAVLGTARIAETVVPRIQATSCAAVIGVAGRDAARAREFADRFGAELSWGSYQEALDDPQVDAVYIPLPPSLHCEWTCRAAAAGKHVLCEKPLTASVDETDQMIEACRKHGVVLLDGVMWYHTKRAAAMLKAMHNGSLGDVRQLNAAFTFCWDEFPMDNIRMHRETGGGSPLDLGWYTVGVSLLAFDELPLSVFAAGRIVNQVDVHLNGILRFSNDRFASIECGFDTVKRRWFEAAGTKAALVCDDFTRPWKSDRSRYWIHDAEGISTEHRIEEQPQEESMVEAFVALIHGRETDHRWLELSRRTQVVCSALQSSLECGAPVSVCETLP